MRLSGALPSLYRLRFPLSLTAILLAYGISATSSSAQSLGQWSWMGGSQASNISPVYGTKYQFSPGNDAGLHLEAVTWTDASGRLWLFGGTEQDPFGTSYSGNDLWVFDATLGTHGEWAWMGGAKAGACTLHGCPGSYGTQYQFSSSTLPGSRVGAAHWVDASGNLWLFGGLGYDSAQTYGYLNDLWVFNPTLGTHGQWAWMSGSSTIPCTSSGPPCGSPGNYSTKYTFDPAFVPPARQLAASWSDSMGRFWIFSGLAFLSSDTGQANPTADLWVFDPAQGSHGEWAWMGGDIDPEGSLAPSVYDQKYQYSNSNWPSARYLSAFGNDAQGRLWAFGGMGFLLDSPEQGIYGAILNDLWVFDDKQGPHGLWAWMGGPTSATLNTKFRQHINPSDYGTKHQFSSSSLPGGRYGSSSAIDSAGRLWLYGGQAQDAAGNVGAVNELWAFDLNRGVNGQWAWMGGDQSLACEFRSCGNPPKYGTEFLYSAFNEPGGRLEALSWTDGNGNLRLQGGTINSGGTLTRASDLWEYRFGSPQSITFPRPAAFFTYGDAPITLTATSSSGLPVTLSLLSGPGSLSGSKLTITGGGAVVALNASQAGDTDYLPARDTKQPFWVYKHGLNVQADDKTMQYGAAVPALTWKATGFVNGDTVGTALTGAPVVVTGAKSNWVPGTYKINVNVGTLASNKYKFTFVPGTLTITPLGTVANPNFSLTAGTYAGAQSLSISGTGCPCTFYYTTDGSTPTPTHGTKYSGAFTVSTSETVNAIATKPGYSPSAVASATYTIH